MQQIQSVYRLNYSGFRALALLATICFAVAMPFTAFAQMVPSSPEAEPAAIEIPEDGAGESVADRQLARFRSDPANRGAVCRVGLWRYSRHPNYFFEWVHWWAYVAIGIAGPLGWVPLFGPAVMLLFLLKVTGIPLLEQRLEHATLRFRRRGSQKLHGNRLPRAPDQTIALQPGQLVLGMGSSFNPIEPCDGLISV